jgi:hypothetical protein
MDGIFEFHKMLKNYQVASLLVASGVALELMRWFITIPL